MTAPLRDVDPRKSKPQENSPHFTVFVRLPFPRGDFVDPPPIQWNPTKDAALWDVISKASNGKEVDWHQLADEFDATLAFLLQQAAWLYERQLSQVRAQLRKVNRPLSTGTPPIPSSVHGSGYAVTGAGTQGPRLSRTSSTNTVLQAQKSPPVAQKISNAETASVPKRRSEGHDAPRKSIDAVVKPRRYSSERPLTSPLKNSKQEEASTSSSSQSESEPEEGPMSRSRAYTRRPRYSASKAPLDALSDADEDFETSPPFLPFSDANNTAKKSAGGQQPSSSPSATLRIPPKAQAPQRLSPKTATHKPRASQQNTVQTINSSSSSAQSQPARPPKAPLSSLSPRQRRLAKEASEGTPSMGSSFSDLDDASVTQSALEEALANEMTHGGVASRMSTISQALRSRYL